MRKGVLGFTGRGRVKGRERGGQRERGKGGEEGAQQKTEGGRWREGGREGGREGPERRTYHMSYDMHYVALSYDIWYKLIICSRHFDSDMVCIGLYF